MKLTSRISGVSLNFQLFLITNQSTKPVYPIFREPPKIFRYSLKVQAKWQSCLLSEEEAPKIFQIVVN